MTFMDCVTFWPDDPWVASEPKVVCKIYQEKYNIATCIGAKSVLEIGCRAGYSACCFLAAGAKRYIGLDADNGAWGGTAGCVDFARKMLPEKFPDAKVEIHKLDSQNLKDLSQFDKVDLVHVDASHDYCGCLHDLELSLTCGASWVLIDDITHHADTVGVAAYAFVGKMGFKHLVFPTTRGDMLVKMGN